MNIMMYYIVYIMEGAQIASPLATASIQYVINVVMTLPAILFPRQNLSSAGSHRRLFPHDDLALSSPGRYSSTMANQTPRRHATRRIATSPGLFLNNRPRLQHHRVVLLSLSSPHLPRPGVRRLGSTRPRSSRARSVPKAVSLPTGVQLVLEHGPRVRRASAVVEHLVTRCTTYLGVLQCGGLLCTWP
jgi:hypothetical protein